MDQAVYERIQQLQRASFFRAQTPDGHARVVDSPFLGGPISSAFERPARFEDPALEVARMGVHEVHFACFGFDAVRDGLEGLKDIALWLRQGAINVRSMAGGRC